VKNKKIDVLRLADLNITNLIKLNFIKT